MIKSIKKKSFIAAIILMVFVAMIPGFENSSVYAKSSSNAKVKKTNKKADKAYMKVVSKIFQSTASEWDNENYDNSVVNYLFKDLNGDGIHEAIIVFRHNTGGSGGYEYAVYTYKKKKAKRILLDAEMPSFKVYKESGALVALQGKRGWEWYDCFLYNGKKYVLAGSNRRNNNYDSSDTMSDEEYYSVLNEYCYGEVEDIDITDFIHYYEKRLKNTGYSGEDVYTAYLNLIRGEKTKIDNYNWQMGYYGYGTFTSDMISKPIAFTDIYGDTSPEMIYFTYNDPYADYFAIMNIVTYEDGKVKKLFDGYSDGKYGKSYYLFQLKGDRTLYIYDAFGDINWSEYYQVLEDGSQGYSLNEIYRMDCYQEGEFPHNEYYKNKTDIISEKEYMNAIEDFENNTEKIIMSTKLYSGFEKEFVDKYGCQAMTSDEAIRYLESEIDAGTIK